MGSNPWREAKLTYDHVIMASNVKFAILATYSKQQLSDILMILFGNTKYFDLRYKHENIIKMTNSPLLRDTFHISFKEFFFKNLLKPLGRFINV